MMPMPDEEERLLRWVYLRSLTTAEMDTQRFRGINAEQLQLGTHQSEREAAEAMAEVARVAKLKRKQDRLAQRLQGDIVISDSSSSDGADSDIGPPPVADA
ncbi:Phosphorylated carbohydrates phosphatase [Hordeum vulgare]|nr:Phosphorylated carbohydrates phosphatase [Hordeum vulgare]